MKGRWQNSNRKPEIVLILFMIISNVAIIAYWYKNLHEKNTFIIRDEKRIPVTKGAVNGHLDKMIVRDSSYVEFFGWAFDNRNSCLPDGILISYNGENIHLGKTNHNRPGLVYLFGNAALNAGFKFVIPLERLKDRRVNHKKVRVFAISNGVASELIYRAGFK